MSMFRQHRPPSEPCPDLHTLDRYMVRELAATRRLKTKRHVASCARCQRLIQEVLTNFQRINVKAHAVKLHQQTLEIPRLPPWP